MVNSKRVFHAKRYCVFLVYLFLPLLLFVVSCTREKNKDEAEAARSETTRSSEVHSELDLNHNHIQPAKHSETDPETDSETDPETNTKTKEISELPPPPPPPQTQEPASSPAPPPPTPTPTPTIVESSYTLTGKALSSVSVSRKTAPNTTTSTTTSTKTTATEKNSNNMFLIESIFSVTKKQLETFSPIQSRAYVQDGLLNVYASHDTRIGRLEHGKRIVYKEEILHLVSLIIHALQNNDVQSLETHIFSSEKELIMRQLRPLFQYQTQHEEFFDDVRVGEIRDIGSKSKVVPLRIFVWNSEFFSDARLQVYVDFINGEWLVSAVEGDATSFFEQRANDSLFEPSGANGVGDFF